MVAPSKVCKFYWRKNIRIQGNIVRKTLKKADHANENNEINIRKQWPLSQGVRQKSGFRRRIWTGITGLPFLKFWSLMGARGFGMNIGDRNSIGYLWRRGLKI